ncbi:MAG: glycosyltransferase, partial [Candidatus Uhrbacteria bacterium]|nr:glycosyltransferase [Candidatus Uhrbacteria bacterium]
MRILMDGRPLLRPWMGGVPRLAASLASAIKSALGEDELVIATTGSSPLSPPHLEEGAGGGATHKRIPNKLVAFLTFIGLSSFDRMFNDQMANVLFLPNLEFVGRPRVPYALLVHDLSFLIEPRWFDRKSRIWHTLVKPKTLIKNATHLFAVSETTKRDLTRLLDIDADRVTVIPMGLDPLPALPDNDRLSGAHNHAPLPRNGRF